MLVRIRSQEVYDVQWESTFGVHNTVRHVWREFSVHFGLSNRPCQLHLDSTSLDPGSTMLQVKSGLGSSSILELTASFDATLAFRIWYTLNQESRNNLALARAWRAVMQCQHRSVWQQYKVGKTTSKANKSTELFFSYLMFADGDSLVAPELHTELPQPPHVLPQDAICYMLHQLVTAPLTQGTESTTTLPEAQAHASEHPSQQSDEHLTTSLHCDILHALLILLKIALLTGTVPACSHTKNAGAASRALWLAIYELSDQLQKYDAAQVAAAATQPATAAEGHNIAMQILDAKSSKNSDLSQVLARKVLLALPEVIGQPEQIADIMCKLLSALMIRSNKQIYQAVAADLSGESGISMMIDMCCCKKKRAHKAFQVLCDISDASMLPLMQVRDAQRLIQKFGLNSHAVLAQLLCPDIEPDVPGQDGALEIMAVEYFTYRWLDINGCTKEELPTLCKVATMLSELVGMISSVCNCGVDHTWSRLEKIAHQAFVTLLWLLGSNHLQTEPSRVLDQQEIKLAKALWTLIDRCLKGYIADLSLEFEQMLQNILMAATPSMQQEALQDFQPCVDMISGGLRRCATDQSVYDNEAKNPLIRGKCAATHMFLMFWMFLDYTCPVLRSHPLLGKIFDALHAFFTVHTWPVICMSGSGIQYKGMSPIQQLDMCDILHRLEPDLPAQLTAGACLAVLCKVEATSELNLHHTPETTYCQQAAESNTFGLLVKLMERAVQRECPWPADLCVGLARLVYQLHRLVNITTDPLLKELPKLHKVLQQAFKKLPGICRYIKLQRELLAGCIILSDALRNADASSPAAKGLGRTLTDCIVRQAGKHSSATNKPPPAYSPVGLAKMGPVQMHSRILNSALSSLDTPEDWRYFGKHALPDCSDAFVMVAEQQMQEWSDDSIEDAGSDRYQHFRPYFAMLCSYARMHPSPPKAYPQELACAMLQALHVLVMNLDSTHRATVECKGMLEEGQQQLLNMSSMGMQNHARVLQLQKKLDGLTTTGRKMSEGMRDIMVPGINAAVDSMAEMRKDPKWTEALSKAADAESEQGWCEGKRGPPQRLRQWLKALAKTQHLSSDILLQIEDCFSPEKILELGAAEDAEAQQQESGEEAIARAAAKAAAKKAKKQRQKARKQQDQQQEQEDQQHGQQGDESSVRHALRVMEACAQQQRDLDDSQEISISQAQAQRQHLKEQADEAVRHLTPQQQRFFHDSMRQLEALQEQDKQFLDQALSAWYDTWNSSQPLHQHTHEQAGGTHEAKRRQCAARQALSLQQSLQTAAAAIEIPQTPGSLHEGKPEAKSHSGRLQGQEAGHQQEEHREGQQTEYEQLQQAGSEAAGVALASTGVPEDSRTKSKKSKKQKQRQKREEEAALRQDGNGLAQQSQEEDSKAQALLQKQQQHENGLQQHEEEQQHEKEQQQAGEPGLQGMPHPEQQQEQPQAETAAPSQQVHNAPPQTQGGRKANKQHQQQSLHQQETPHQQQNSQPQHGHQHDQILQQQAGNLMAALGVDASHARQHGRRGGKVQQAVQQQPADEMLSHAVAIGFPQELASEPVAEEATGTASMQVMEAQEAPQLKEKAVLQPGFEQEQLAGTGMWDLLSCPLTKELLSDPVIAADGFTYERHALHEWLRSHTTSPVTGHVLTSTIVVPNHVILNIIADNR